MLEYMNKNGYSNVTKFNRLVYDSFFWDHKEKYMPPIWRLTMSTV